MDPSVPNVDEYIFNLNYDWKEFYGGIVEEDPHQMPEPLGKTVFFGCFVDAYNGGNVITRRLHSGRLLFVNNTLDLFHPNTDLFSTRALI